MQALLQAIATVRDRIQRHGTLCASSEFQTRYGLIDPILRALEWDVSNPDEVRVNYAIKADDDSAVSGWADYVLMHQNKPRVVIKAIVHGQWDSSAYVQGTKYCKALGVSRLVCANGENWEIYDLNKPLANRLIFKVLLSRDSVTTIAQALLVLWKTVICEGLSQPPLIFTADMSTSAIAASNTGSVPTTGGTPPNYAIPLTQVLQQKFQCKPSAMYFPPGYERVFVKSYFKEILRQTVLYLSHQNLIPLMGVPPIVVPCNPDSVGCRRYHEVVDQWCVYTHGSAVQVVDRAINILKRCGVNPRTVYVS